MAKRQRGRTYISDGMEWPCDYDGMMTTMIHHQIVSENLVILAQVKLFNGDLISYPKNIAYVRPGRTVTLSRFAAEIKILKSTV